MLSARKPASSRIISLENSNLSNRLFLSDQVCFFSYDAFPGDQPLNGIKAAFNVINYVINILYADAKADGTI